MVQSIHSRLTHRMDLSYYSYLCMSTIFASPPPLQVDIVDHRVVRLLGQKEFISYCIKVTHGDSSWSVYYTEEQIKKLGSQLLQPVIEGYLHKKAENWLSPKQWNKRYFKFLGNTLYYSDEMISDANIFSNVYRKIEITGAKVTPTYDMDKVVKNSQIPNDILTMKAMFEIHQANGKIAYLRATSQGEMLRWVEALQDHQTTDPSLRRKLWSAPVINKTEPLSIPPSPILRGPPSPTILRSSKERSSPSSPPSFPPSPPSSPPSSPPTPEVIRSPRGGLKTSIETFFGTGTSGSTQVDQPTTTTTTTTRPRRNTEGEPTRPVSAIVQNTLRQTINVFLKNLCTLHQGSDMLRSFLLVNAYAGDEFPQQRIILDAFDNSDLALIRKLHGECGVPILFSLSGKHSFTEACRQGRTRIVEYMFATEPPSVTEELIYKTDNFDHTALHYAFTSSLELALILINRSSIDYLVSLFGTWTPLHHLAKVAKVILHDHLDIVRQIVIALRKHINAVDMVENQTALHICAKECNSSVAMILLQNNANINILTNHGKTFLQLLVSNTSTKSHDMTAQVLQHMYNSANSLQVCTKQLEFLDLVDNDGRSAILCAIAKDPHSPHVNLLMKHYEQIEDFKFTFVMNEILFLYNQPSAVGIIMTQTTFFKLLAETINASSSVSDYHRDIVPLITRYQQLIARTRMALGEAKISETQRADFMDALQKATYLSIFSLFQKKKAAVDFVLRKYLELYKTNATRISMGITEEFWRRVQAKEGKIQIQLGSRRDAYESTFVKRAIGILSSIPNIEKPEAKIQCIIEILSMFECHGDEEFSLLSYLIVRASDFNICWSAEIDYIMTMMPADKYINLLKSIQMFFLASWNNKINSPQPNNSEAQELAEEIVEDLRALLEYSQTIPTGAADCLLLLALFFFLSQESKTVTLPGSFSGQFRARPQMFSITQKLQLTLREMQENGTVVICAPEISNLVFVRLTSIFLSMLSREEA